MKTLVIAEKPSVAQDLARVLGIKPGRGAEFFENESYVISSAVGHLLEIAPPAGAEVARGKWKLENLPSLPPTFDLVPIDRNAARLAVLKKLIKRKEVTAIINACDAGREGELIFRNIIRAANAKQPIKRLWLQSMTPTAIKAAFASLRSDEEMLPLADAAISRSEADWLVGINSTRALTSFNSRDGGFQKTTAGRVQTPTLAILAEREVKIRAFVPRDYFEVYGDFGVKSGAYRGRWLDEKFDKGGDDEQAKAERIWDKAKADAIAAKCTGKVGIIEEEKKPASQLSPLLFDLTSLQREANSKFGFPARMTLQIAQALYEKHKVLTYPRTDSRFLPEDHVATAKSVMGSFSGALAKHAGHALTSGWVKPNKRIFNNAKVSDHFAIVPTGTPATGLDDKEQRIFDLVSRRFVAVFYPAAHFEVTTRITRVEGEAFKTDGKVIVDPGWMAIYGREAEGEDGEKSIVPIEAGEKADTRSVVVEQKVTKAAARYSEATLLSAMEGAGKLVDDEELREAMSERGLGTPATRAQVIEGLLTEGYIVREGRDLIVTQKGLSLITLLKNLHAESLIQPALTGEWEFKLREMERGKLSRNAFMQDIRTLTTDIVNKVKAHGDAEIKGDFQPINVKCPRCEASPFAETFRSYKCESCALVIWKTMAARELERVEVEKLLTEGAVGPLDGFRNKFGRPFSAVVKLNKEEWKATFDFGKDDSAESGEPPVWTVPEPIGKCRCCKEGVVYETEKNYVCDKVHLKECSFKMGKMILQKTISRSDVAHALETGKTSLIPGFISARTRRAFKAFLVIQEGGKVGFEFAPREPKKPAVKKGKAASAKAEE